VTKSGIQHSHWRIAGRDVHFISFLFVIEQQFRAENTLLSSRIKISTFCSFTGRTFRQKVINCPAIANAWTLHAILWNVSESASYLKKAMTKLLFILTVSTIVFVSCGNQAAQEENKVALTNQKVDTTEYNGLHGTWVRHNKAGFTLIEIKDTSNIMYYQFLDRQAALGKPISDRYWYYKSKATLGYWNSPDNPYKADVDIWIATDEFRFDYKLRGDTLIEFDKMGDQGRFVKVYNGNK
jgi:hypothetical protein